MLVQYEGCFPQALLSLASFCPRCEVFFKARGASREPKDVFSRALFPNARGASEWRSAAKAGIQRCPWGLLLGSVCQPSNLAWHDVHDDLLHNTRAMTHTPASTDFAEPGLAVCGDGPLVEVVDIQDDTAQPQDIEGVLGQQGYSLRCIPAVPAVLFADDDSQFGCPFRVVDIEQ